MIYTEYKGKEISMLAMGTMRLPVIDGKDADIDVPKAEEMVRYAYNNGVNYFDTAWGYHGGNSELVVGKALKEFPRESFYLADKFPGYDLNNMGKVEEIFEEQLKKCGVEYFDFYMFHNVCEKNIDHYLNEEYGIHEYLMKQKANGRIKHLGVSGHGEYEVMERFLEKYGKDMEFCQLQVNYLDYEFQHARDKMELMAKYDLPIWVMEPMRGGRLAKLSESQEARLKALRPDESIAAWAHRFLQELPEVVTVLTGASSLEQLDDNIATFEDERPFTDEEKATLQEIIEEMLSEKTVPCTACKYCLDHCPKKLDIPVLLSMYNEHNFSGGGFMVPFRMGTFDESAKPNQCIACGACEKVCPQNLPISETLADFVEQLNKSAF